MLADGPAPGGTAEAAIPGPDEPRRAVPSAWVILAVLIFTVLSLVASALYSTRAADKLDRAAMSIATDASPAIEHLTAVREQILHITVVAAEAVERSTDGAPFDPAEFTRSLALLHRDLSAYSDAAVLPTRGDPLRERRTEGACSSRSA